MKNVKRCQLCINACLFNLKNFPKKQKKFQNPIDFLKIVGYNKAQR